MSPASTLCIVTTTVGNNVTTLCSLVCLPSCYQLCLVLPTCQIRIQMPGRQSMCCAVYFLFITMTQLSLSYGFNGHENHTGARVI